MAEEYSQFGILPLEVVAEIFDLLGLREKKKSRLVCHRWRLVLDSQKYIVFRPKLTNQSSVKYFLNSYRRMDCVVMRNTKMGKMAADNQFPIVKNAELGWKNSQESIVKFLRDGCEHAESLTIAKFSMERISRKRLSRVLSNMKWNNLIQLKLHVVMTSYKQLRARKHLWNMITFLTVAEILKLQDFEFNFIFRGGFTKKRQYRFQKLFLGFYIFLADHAKSLQILNGRIETVSRRKLQIPEIPIHLKSTIISNLRLQTCALKFWGVRNPETFVFPDLFGSDLKTLRLETSREIYGNLAELDLTLDDTLLNKNLKTLFEANSKTLRQVYLDLRFIDASWLKNCSSLEYLTLYIRDNFPNQEIVILPIMNLKLLKLHSHGQPNPFPREILQLSYQYKRTLEHLEICLDEDFQFYRTSFRLNEFVALKFLRLDKLTTEFIASNTGTAFPHLMELRTYLDPENCESASEWIAKSMRNLQNISLYGGHTGLCHIKTILTIPTLDNVMFCCNSWDFQEEVEEFCETTLGINLLSMPTKIDLNFEKIVLIGVDRSIFKSLPA